MTLESGDRVFFDITPTHMTLQAVQFDNLEQDGESLEYKGDCDTVVLYGRDVARLLDALTNPWKEVAVVKSSSESSMLSTKATSNTFWLETDDNAVSLTGPERDMLLGAIASRAWRLFQ